MQIFNVKIILTLLLVTCMSSEMASANNVKWANIEGTIALEEQNRRQAEANRPLTREEAQFLGAVLVGAARLFKDQGKSAPKPVRHYYATTGRAKDLAGQTLTFNETHRAIGKVWLDERALSR